jgi:perosamine synthetase
MNSKNSSNIPWAKPAIDDTELNEVIACMKSGWLSSGPRVAKFESEMAARAHRKFAVAVSNGTAALDVALRALGIDRLDEVVVPAFSYIATASTVVIQGAKPVFCDIDPRNLCMDPQSAAECVTSRTGAILCTDYGGNPCDFASLTALADRHNIPLILDGAQSIGTLYNAKPALSFGRVSTVSFHAAKTMTSVEGGMVFTDDETLAHRMRIIRSHGEDPNRKYHHVELGHNFRTTELQAAIGLAQLTKLDALLSNRLELASQYTQELSDIALRCPITIENGVNSFFLYSILVPNRDWIAQRLKERGIETRICYPIPLYDQPILKKYKKRRCPVAEETCAGILNLPLFFGMTRLQQRRVAKEIRDALIEAARIAA